MDPGSRIALVTPFKPSDRTGGVEVFCTQLQQALGPIDVFAPAWNANGYAPLLARFGLQGPFRAVRGARAFLEEHGRRPYGVVIANGYSGWPFRFVKVRIPKIQVYHFTLAGLAKEALPLRSERLTTARIGGWFDRMSGVGQTVVSVSESVRSEVAKYYGLRSLVVPNAVDVDLFRKSKKSEARERLGLPRDATIGLFVGRAEYAKGFDVFSAVARSMDDVLFLSVSSPEAAPPNVRFFMNVAHADMPALYSASDFFLSPSRYEGFSLSLLEALSCELPTVATQAACAFGDEPRELGIVVADLTSGAFVEGIHRALEDGPNPGARERIIHRYSMDAFRRNWRGLISRVLAAGLLGDA